MHGYRNQQSCCRNVEKSTQNTLLLNGADKALPLYKQIDELKYRKIISKEVANLAHGIRYLWNFGAHPDDDLFNDISYEDAKPAYQTVLKILRQLF